MIEYRIRQSGITVAKASTELEAWHYAMQYWSDGELTIQHNAEGHWKRLALLCKRPEKESAR